MCPPYFGFKLTKSFLDIWINWEPVMFEYARGCTSSTSTDRSPAQEKIQCHTSSLVQFSGGLVSQYRDSKSWASSSMYSVYREDTFASIQTVKPFIVKESSCSLLLLELWFEDADEGDVDATEVLDADGDTFTFPKTILPSSARVNGCSCTVLSRDVTSLESPSPEDS